MSMPAPSTSAAATVVFPTWEGPIKTVTLPGEVRKSLCEARSFFSSFVVIGGVALVAHGIEVAVRDLDIVVPRSYSDDSHGLSLGTDLTCPIDVYQELSSGDDYSSLYPQSICARAGLVEFALAAVPDLVRVLRGRGSRQDLIRIRQLERRGADD